MGEVGIFNRVVVFPPELGDHHRVDSAARRLTRLQSHPGRERTNLCASRQVSHTRWRRYAGLSTACR